MKTRNYRNGTFTARSYLKSAGNGWEVGFVYGGKPIFLGNFVHQSEANAWWGLMNREIRAFSRRFKVTRSFPKATYGRFLCNHLYSRYYNYLDRLFTKHTSYYGRAVRKETRAFRRIVRRAAPGPRLPFLKAA